MLFKNFLRHKVVLIHGAGSFGHFQAKKYTLSSGGSIDEWKQGTTLTRQRYVVTLAKTYQVSSLARYNEIVVYFSVLKLNGLVVDALIKEGVPAVGISPFPTVVSSKKVELLATGVLNSVSELIRNGLVPVIHGDVIIDRVQRCTILSGDRIMTW